VGYGEGVSPQNFFLILDLKIANCGAFLVQFFAVQLVAFRPLKVLPGV